MTSIVLIILGLIQELKINNMKTKDKVLQEIFDNDPQGILDNKEMTSKEANNMLLVITNAINGKSIPIYGDGSQIRDWLYVEDHAEALYLVLKNSNPGETYNIGGRNEKTNLYVVQTICNILEKLHPEKPKGLLKYSDLICFVDDRSGHDVRYAIDCSKIEKDFGWTPLETFESGM